MILMAQPAEVVAKKIRATEKLQLSNKTLTAIVESITVLSTHAQSPTAKAVYDLTAAMITSVSTNATLSGNGTVGDPLGIAQQSATSGQVLKWNGLAWLPAADDNTIQTLSYSAPNLTLSSGGGSVAIPQGDITGSGANLQFAYFTGTKTITSGNNLKFGATGNEISVFGHELVNAGGVLPYASTNDFAIKTKNNFHLFTDIAPSYPLFTVTSAGKFGVNNHNPTDYFYIRSNDLNTYITGETTQFGSVAIPATVGFKFIGGGAYQLGEITMQSRLANVLEGLMQFKSRTAAGSIVTAMAITGDNVGIGTISPAAKLHVVGAARITGSAGTGTSVMIRDASGDVSNATLGAGLSLSGGTLSSTATGTVGGTGVAGKVAYWSGTNTLTSTTNFPFDGTSLAVGRSTAGAGRFNVTGNSTSVGLQVDAGTLPSFGATAQLRGSNSTSNQSFYGIDAEGSTTGAASNYLNKIGNTGAGSTLFQINTTAAGGDPVVQYNLTGGSTNWIHGIDNSDGDKFKLQPFTSVGDGDAGLTITTAGLFGINNQSPLTTLDISNATDGISIPVGTSAQRPVVSDPIIRYNSELQGLEVKNSGNWHLLNSQNSLSLTGSNVAGPSLGTSPTLTINGGFETAYTITLTVGSAPAANGIIYTRNFPFLWSSAPRAVFSAANAITASEITKFYVGTTNGTSYTINANGTLTAGAVYKLNVLVQN